jgi:hypothetical protein
VLALLAWEATGAPGRPPVLALLASVMVWFSFQWLPAHASADAQAAVYLLWSVPLAVWMAARLLGALHLSLRLRGRLGTGDPADTVALVGLLQAARALPGVQLEVEIDWLDEVLEGEAEGSARVWLAEVLAVAALLLLRREHRSALWALAR